MVTGPLTNQHVAGIQNTLENAALRANSVFLLLLLQPLVFESLCSYVLFKGDDVG